MIQTIVSMAANRGGPTRSTRDLCEALAAAGARVTLVTGDDPAAPALLLPDRGRVTTLHVATGSIAGLRGTALAAAIAPHRRTGKPTLLHDNGLWTPANIAAAAGAKRLGLRQVVSPHGMLAPWALAWHRRRKTVAWRLYQRRILVGAAGLVATSAAERADIGACASAVPIATIANGVTLQPLPDRRDRDVDQPRTLLFLSRLHPVKNLAGLLSAWAQLAADPRFAAWTLRIAGPDEAGHRAEIAGLADRLGITARLRIDDAVPDAAKAGAFAAADLFVLPSFTENFGIVVAEALGAGVPVVTTTGTPWADVVGEGCGWHVAPEPAALASALAEAMVLPAPARRAMGARGHALVAARFGWPGIAARMLGFYDWLLHGGTRPDFVDD